MTAPPPPPVSAARLQGTYLMAGRVTAAQAVRGEHAGEHVRRSWTFTPQCATGPCSKVTLVRRRHSAADSLVLHRRAPGRYSGSGSFFAPLRCAGRTYRHGERVPFTITVRITAAASVNGVIVATRLRATYVNRTRINLTPCVVAPGHDAATYRGQPATG